MQIVITVLTLSKLSIKCNPIFNVQFGNLLLIPRKGNITNKWAA